MKKAPVLLALALILGACSTTSRAKPPRSVDLPSQLSFATIAESGVALRVVDKRANQERSDEWVRRVTDDVTAALTNAGVSVSDSAPATLEVDLNDLGAEYGLNNWTGCAKLSSQLTREDMNVVASGEQCIKKFNYFGPKTADEATAMSYREALSQLLERLQAQLRVVQQQPAAPSM